MSSSLPISGQKLGVKIATTTIEIFVFVFYIRTTIRFFKLFYSRPNVKSLSMSSRHDEGEKQTQHVEKDPLTMIMIVLMLTSLSYRIFVNTPAAIYYFMLGEVPNETTSYVFDIIEQLFFYIAK